jgi:hypothetical protein
MFVYYSIPYKMNYNYPREFQLCILRFILTLTHSTSTGGHETHE